MKIERKLYKNDKINSKNMRHHTKHLLLHSPIDREHEMLEKINRAENSKEIEELRLLIYMEDGHNGNGLLEQLKRRENFLKD